MEYQVYRPQERYTWYNDRSVTFYSILFLMLLNHGFINPYCKSFNWNTRFWFDILGISIVALGISIDKLGILKIYYGVPKSRIFDLLSILIEIPSITINTPGISNQSLVYKLNNLKYQLMITHFKSVGKILLKNPVIPRSCGQKT